MYVLPGVRATVHGDMANGNEWLLVDSDSIDIIIVFSKGVSVIFGLLDTVHDQDGPLDTSSVG